MNNRRAIRILIIALIVFSVFSVRSLLRNRESRKSHACLQSLLAIEGVKEQYAIEHDGHAPENMEALVPQYLSNIPVCPSGGTYLLGDMQVPVTCDRTGHHLPD